MWLNCWRKNEVLVVLRTDERCSSSSRNDKNSWNSRRIRNATSRLRLTNNKLLPPRMSSWCDLVILRDSRVVNETRRWLMRSG